MSDRDRIARLKIELDDWQPTIWRCVEVPLTTTLKGLSNGVGTGPLIGVQTGPLCRSR